MKKTVQAVKHTDIRGKEQLYIVIGDNVEERVIINCGEKTFEAVKKITDVPKGTIDEKPKQK